jgi:hypothetical protein
MGRELPGAVAAVADLAGGASTLAARAPRQGVMDLGFFRLADPFVF